MGKVFVLLLKVFDSHRENDDDCETQVLGYVETPIETPITCVKIASENRRYHYKLLTEEIQKVSIEEIILSYDLK